MSTSNETRINNSWEGRKRPNGTDISRYKGINTWPYHRWAWEFLRRNEEFIKACEIVKSGSEEDKFEASQKFGLKKFKNYREGYSSQSGKPRFSDGSVPSISNVDANTDEIIRKRIEIRHGEVFIKFDLNLAIEDKAALAKQLRMAKIHLSNKLATLASHVQKKIPEHRHPLRAFGIYLRLLDLLASGINRADCARALLKDYDQNYEMVNTELQNIVGNRITRAREYANRVYRHLAYLNTTPNISESIPLEINNKYQNE